MDIIYFPYDAMSSWAGYDIQGKMAIYFVIKEIIGKLKNNPTFSFEEIKLLISTVSIELENLEDIAILEDNKYRKVFQVKSGTGTSLKIEDCYNLCIAAHIMKRENKTINSEDDGEKDKAYLISVYNLDTEDKIRTQGKQHITDLINTNYGNDINKESVGKLEHWRKKASFHSLMKKADIMELPISKRKERIESDIINPLKNVLDDWENISVGVYQNEELKDADTIKIHCVNMIKEIKLILVERYKESHEVVQLSEKENEHIYWSLVNKLDSKLFYNKKLDKAPGVRIGVLEFFNEMCTAIDVSIDYISYLSHILIDKLYQELNDIPEYFREENIVNCPEESKSCLSCVDAEDCVFLKKVNSMINMESTQLLSLFSHMFLSENKNKLNLNNLPSDDDIQAVVYRNMGRYDILSYEDGIPRAKEIDLIAEMSSADNASRIVKRISKLSETDIEFIKQIFESKFLFHVRDKGAVPGFHFGNNEKFMNIISEDLSSEQREQLHFLPNEEQYNFLKPDIIKVVGKKEAEEIINGKVNK